MKLRRLGRRAFRRAALPVGVLLVILALYLLWADRYIESASRDAIFENIADLPATDVALVLGTSKYVSTGKPNEYYSSRIKAAAGLYGNGKVQGFVVSGDNSTTQYNEPQRMRQDLGDSGVPEKYVTCDYAGFRTLDSIVRMKAVFGYDRYTIVSQRFHLERAIYLARAFGQNPIGYAAEVPPGGVIFKTRFREILARGMALIDVNILHRAPKFLGEPITPNLLKAPPEGAGK